VAAAGPPELAVQIGIQQQQLEETLKIYEKNLVTIETSRRVHEKLLEEVGQTVESLTPKALALGAWYQAKLFWNSELFPMGGESITYGKAVTCITILVVGWIMSRFTSGVFANRFLKRFRLSKDATSVIRSLVFYSLLILVSLAALNTINVPLTAFTILGGALAIGVGFGSQTLINNFIGGLIMLAERPVRLGERIMFGGMEGIVEDIGFRCTKLRTPTDHLVTIPNSTLVNESIENIGRRRTIRRKMNVTITYDTPRELVAEAVQAIRDILDEKEIRERIHPIVGFEEFPPRVHFNDFNAESLNIVVFYWYAPVDWWAYMQHSERVNYRIMEEFERLGVEFAFPTQTIYLKNQAIGAAASDATFHDKRNKSSAA
jgi:small-conductance mechanosensitive channel